VPRARDDGRRQLSWSQQHSGKGVQQTLVSACPGWLWVHAKECRYSGDQRDCRGTTGGRHEDGLGSSDKEYKTSDRKPVFCRTRSPQVTHSSGHANERYSCSARLCDCLSAE